MLPAELRFLMNAHTQVCSWINCNRCFEMRKSKVRETHSSCYRSSPVLGLSEHSCFMIIQYCTMAFSMCTCEYLLSFPVVFVWMRKVWFFGTHSCMIKWFWEFEIRILLAKQQFLMLRPHRSTPVKILTREEGRYASTMKLRFLSFNFALADFSWSRISSSL
jgi:hypothetical protein